MTDKNFNMIPLFGIPLYQTVIEPGVSDEELNFVISQEYERFAADNGFSSMDKFLLDQPELKNLKQKLLHKCEHFLHEVLDIDESKAKFDITNSWSVKHIKGDESGPHSHSGSMFSAVYYLQTEQDSGEIVFHKEKTNYNVLTPTVNVPYKNKNFNICNSEAFAIPPRNNMMVMFPSTLSHSVNPSKSNTERFCIAFNLFAFGKFDQGGRSQLGLQNITNI
jgi:uncharacterized protein (TIGR02466 family)